MKKTRVFILFLLLMTFPSCASVPQTAPQLREFSSEAEITYGRLTFSGTLDVYSHADIRFTFSCPENLNGFSLRTVPDGYRCSVFGKEDFIPAEVMPEDSAAALIFDALEAAVFIPSEKRRNADGDYVSESPGGRFEAIYDRDGKPKLISSPGIDFYMVIK